LSSFVFCFVFQVVFYHKHRRKTRRIAFGEAKNKGQFRHYAEIKRVFFVSDGNPPLSEGKYPLFLYARRREMV